VSAEDGRTDGRWDQDRATHDRISENARRRSEARAEQDARAEDPAVRMRRCFEQEPDPPDRAA
jgi:hypothetical protein